MNTQQKKYRTQWTAQFYAAAELTRRNYIVSFTLGNAPVVDLHVVCPQGDHFMVDVKGLSNHNFWLVREREPQVDLFYILVYIPETSQPPEFFILSSKEMMDGIESLRTKTIKAGKNWNPSGAGLNWGGALEFKDRWGSLPG
jgi:hypothetical protein